MQSYSGGCHCGQVRFRVTGDLARATICNCSICSKKGFLHLIVPSSDFELLAGAEALVSYRFDTGVAEHKFCNTCGIHSFYTPRSDPDKVDVNVRCLDDVDLSTVEVQLFDGKHWEEAIRSAHWQKA
ncbi:MAG: GFA family protein [Myxococcales bacterium]|jgi:hypothetical protein